MSLTDEWANIGTNSGDTPSAGPMDVTRTVRVYVGVALMSGLIGLLGAVIGGLFSASAAKESMAAERDGQRKLFIEQRAQESRAQRAAVYTKFLDRFDSAVDAVNHVGNCRRGTRQQCSGVGPAATVARVDAQRAQSVMYAYASQSIISISTTMLDHLAEAADAVGDVSREDTSTTTRWLRANKALQSDKRDFRRTMCRDVNPLNVTC